MALTPLKAISERAVLAALSGRWRTVTTITDAMHEVDIQRVHYRLNRMAKAGLIETDQMTIGTRRNSRTNVYRLREFPAMQTRPE